MDAKLLLKGVRQLCDGRGRICAPLDADNCPLYDGHDPFDSCCAGPCYHGSKDPVPIVAQWLEEHPEPVRLPKRISIYDDADVFVAKLDAIIDYLAAREEKEKNE